MMLRLCLRGARRHCYHHFHDRRPRLLSSSKTPIESPPINLQISRQLPPPSPPPSSILRPTTTTTPPPSSSLSRKYLLTFSATGLISSLALYALISSSDDDRDYKTSNSLYAAIERAIQRYGDSINNVFLHIKQTGVAASVLWQSLRSVLSSANHEVRSGFELRVASLLADIVAANESRRAAIVGAGGGGAVVDWLLDSVAVQRDGSGGTQAESARALAYLISDPNVSAAVLGRPGAVPKLLRFIFSCQPQRSKKQSRRSSLDVSDSLKGRSMLVAAIMDIVTSNCDGLENIAFKPSLPGNAATRDIAAAIQVIEEGGMFLDESVEHEDDGDGGGGIKGIGIKVLGGTTVLGLSRTNELLELRNPIPRQLELESTMKSLVLQHKHENSLAKTNLNSAVVPGLWDDLHCEHVAVPFAAWALANWAMASAVNRSLIEELDQDGNAVMTALMAPERSVKWHGSLVARLLLVDHNLPLNDYVSDWSSTLLSTVHQASKNEDIPLARLALSAFLVSIERSRRAQKLVMEKGLHLMRDTAKRTTRNKNVQEALAKALELICAGDLHFSLQESQKWSGILLSWVFEKSSSDTLRSSAIKILSCILEDHGPHSIPMSQGWLAILLSEVLAISKAASIKANVQPKNDKVKTQIDQSNIVSAAQAVNQLASAVVNIAGNQLGTTTDSVDAFPLADLFSMEPLVGPSKNLKKDSVPKFDVADSAVATLKGIKALGELCSDDLSCQKKITDYGVLCLLKRLLLSDDYEKLAAITAYDASKIHEAQDRDANVPSKSSVSGNNDPSSVRVPPTAHIRRHATRLLTILSLLPKVQKIIIADEAWCTWLESCANGKIPGCSDLKIQSYARATLLNIFCHEEIDEESANGDIPKSGTAKRRKSCPRYDDIIYLINPELPHWKCPENIDKDEFRKDSSSSETIAIDHNDKSVTKSSTDDDLSSSDAHVNRLGSVETPLLDVVFIHGLRGGPYKTWRISEDKSSTKSGLVEKIDQEAGKLGTFWPGEWLSADFREARMFTLKYKTNLTQWSGASLPLQEVSSMLLEKLVAAGIGDRPVVFVTHSMGGLVVKQMLYKAKTENFDNLVKNTVGVVFYSCPHFGSRLADMPWRMGLVLRPAPSIGELRSGSAKLVELNDFTRHLHKKGLLEVLSFCETKVTPIVEGYGGWAFRMEIVPIESAYPGFGELVVLESTDHINSCKPVNRLDPSYTETLEFLRKLKARYS